MQNRFTVFQRGAVFYCEDQTTGQQKSLRTREEAEARRIVQAKNDAVKLPQMNLVMAKTYLSAQDPKMIIRTWADVLARFCDRSNNNTRKRHERVARTKQDGRLQSCTASCSGREGWQRPNNILDRFSDWFEVEFRG